MLLFLMANCTSTADLEDQEKPQDFGLSRVLVRTSIVRSKCIPDEKFYATN